MLKALFVMMLAVSAVAVGSQAGLVLEDATPKIVMTSESSITQPAEVDKGGACTMNRVRIKNSTDYTIRVSVISSDKDLHKTLGPQEWFDDYVFFTSNVTIRTNYNGNVRNFQFSANSNCVTSGRIVRVSPGIVNVEPF